MNRATKRTRAAMPDPEPINGEPDPIGSRRQTLPSVTVQLARCPACDSTRHRMRWSAWEDDGSYHGRAECRQCGERFRILGQ